MTTSLLLLLLLSATLNAALAHKYDYSFVTGKWQKFPGYNGTLDASKIDGFLTLKGEKDDTSVLKMTGTLRGLPSGKTGGIHIHDGYDVSDADTVGAHFHPKRCGADGNCAIYYDHDDEGQQSTSIDGTSDPWANLKWRGPNAEISFETDAMSWRLALGHVVVIHDESGAKAAITQVIRKGQSWHTKLLCHAQTIQVLQECTSQV